MQKTTHGATPRTGIMYRERLTPSLWAFVGAAVAAPMAAMVFVPFDTTFALGIGVVVAIVVIWLLLAAAPRIEVREGVLRAGRAHIRVDLLGSVDWLTGADARQLRGPGLPRAAWHLIRGGIDGIVRIEVVDPEDPTPVWIVSSRTPDRLAAAIRRAQMRLTDRSGA
jgi:hypothetical protein